MYKNPKEETVNYLQMFIDNLRNLCQNLTALGALGSYLKGSFY